MDYRRNRPQPPGRDPSLGLAELTYFTVLQTLNPLLARALVGRVELGLAHAGLPDAVVAVGLTAPDLGYVLRVEQIDLDASLLERLVERRPEEARALYGRRGDALGEHSCAFSTVTGGRTTFLESGLKEPVTPSASAGAHVS